MATDMCKVRLLVLLSLEALVEPHIVSPPQEHIQGDQWYTAYQPVSYKIASNRGIREEFKNMVDRCKDAGILVIVGMSYKVLLSRRKRLSNRSRCGDEPYDEPR